MDYRLQQENLLQYYSNLLIVQYHNCPKAIATVKLHIGTLLSNMIPWKLRDLCLNVDKSVGKQLDIIGEWVGVNRYISIDRYQYESWYAYIDWDNESEPNSEQGGLRDWSNVQLKIDGKFLGYEHLVTTQKGLNDDIFRYLIKLKIIKNNIDCNPKTIDKAIQQLFGDEVYTVWGECMLLVYKYKPSKASIIELARDKGVLPCPSGVEMRLEELING